ncbi:MAG: hypothetical protein QHH74_08295 [Spirochaetota bacterium]|nr:hypothetical protein [Spirochaetota bacterium]
MVNTYIAPLAFLPACAFHTIIIMIWQQAVDEKIIDNNYTLVYINKKGKVVS